MRQASKGQVRTGFAVGFLAAVAMVLFMVALRLAFGSESLVEALADWFTEITPPRVFDFLLTLLRERAKPLLFVGLIVAMLLAGGVVGSLYLVLGYRIPLWRRQVWLRNVVFGAAIAAVVLVIVGVALAPAIDAGLFGSSLIGGVPGFTITSGISFLVYGLSLTGLMERVRPLRPAEGAPSPVDTGRRTFLKRMAVGTAIVAGAGFVVRSIMQEGGSIRGARITRRPGEMSPLITPNEDFYIISKNIIDPEVEAEKWKLTVEGHPLDSSHLVESPFQLSYEELRSLPSVEQFVTLICISNEVGDNLISNALWRGVRLREILRRAKLRPGVEAVTFFAKDQYDESIPLELAMREEVLVAYEMNGEPLPSRHGFPARLLVPGRYGLKSVKWLTHIRPRIRLVPGYWQQRGWSQEAIIKTMSRIDVPRSRARVPVGQAVALGGVAFAGLRGIRRVEISADRGFTWEEAKIIEGPLSPYTWVLWAGSLTPEVTGRRDIRVRATDATGQVQTTAMTKPFPDGASGHHSILIRIQEAQT